MSSEIPSIQGALVLGLGLFVSIFVWGMGLLVFGGVLNSSFDHGTSGPEASRSPFRARPLSNGPSVHRFTVR